MLRQTLSALLCGVLLATPALAQIYKTTDADGNVVFTDQPPTNSTTTESIELPPTNTTPPPPVIAPINPRPSPEAAEPIPVEVSINSPANETTIPMGGGIFDVSAAASPPLSSGQTLQLLMDGTPQGPPQTTATWKLENVFRGPHDLVVQRLDSNGKVIATPDPVRVYVLRPGI